MSTNAGAPDLKISAYTSLEQAMAEVRAYLEARQGYTAAPPEAGSAGANKMSMQGAFVGRLTDIANRLDYVDPNSKLGGAGFFLKRVVRKLIAWYSRPVQEFDRTAAQAFAQIRQDMLLLQQQIGTLERKLEAQANAAAGSSAARPLPVQNEQLQSALLLFRSTINAPAVRQALQQDKPELLQRIEKLLRENEPGADSSTPVARS